MAKHECDECHGEIDGDPWWFAPLGNQNSTEYGLELGASAPVQSPEPPPGLEGRAMPLHRECLDRRLADYES